jgi:hypothetical protein
VFARRGCFALLRDGEHDDNVNLRTGDRQGLVASRLCHGLIALVIVVALVIQLALIFTGGQDANSGQASAFTTSRRGRRSPPGCCSAHARA